MLGNPISKFWNKGKELEGYHLTRNQFKIIFLGLHSEKGDLQYYGIQQLDPGNQDKLHRVHRLLAVTKL